ncbi:uncharacterized protein LOC122290824 [Carya illinoinensis]|uniref:uncharacterized protein LOC122290824 n=1 Tax=Carya illinoinensis TaxID=32201 RepID=UPI001C727C14|nr:uncharacterized protein LOC122290824 [Carya illinoinensis]
MPVSSSTPFTSLSLSLPTVSVTVLTPEQTVLSLDHCKPFYFFFPSLCTKPQTAVTPTHRRRSLHYDTTVESCPTAAGNPTSRHRNCRPSYTLVQQFAAEIGWLQSLGWCRIQQNNEWCGVGFTLQVVFNNHPLYPSVPYQTACKLIHSSNERTSFFDIKTSAIEYALMYPRVLSNVQY